MVCNPKQVSWHFQWQWQWRQWQWQWQRRWVSLLLYALRLYGECLWINEPYEVNNIHHPKQYMKDWSIFMGNLLNIQPQTMQSTQKPGWPPPLREVGDGLKLGHVGSRVTQFPWLRHFQMSVSDQIQIILWTFVRALWRAITYLPNLHTNRHFSASAMSCHVKHQYHLNISPC